MATYSKLGVYISGRIANVDMSGHILNVLEIQLGSTSLDETDLGTLIGGSSDASSLHNHDGSYASTSHDHAGVYAPVSHDHDGSYYTETELGSTTDGSSGASLIGVDQTPAFSNISGATVQAMIESIDSALSSAGITSFSDADFEIYDADNTDRKVVFSVNKTTTTDTVITVGENAFDTDSVLSDVSDNTSAISGHVDGGSNKHDASEIDVEGAAYNYVTQDTDLESAIGELDGQIKSNADNISTLDSDKIEKDGSVAFTADQSMGSHKITSLANGVDTNDAVNKGQLEAVESSLSSLINNFEWQDSALDYITDNTVAPPTEVSGDRYVLSHDGGSPHADWDGASAGDIVEFDGSAWQAVTPTTGMFISIDDVSNALYQWGGSSWATKAFESTTASTGLTKSGVDIQLTDANTGGVNISSGAVSANVDDSTIEKGAAAGNPLQVKDGGIVEAKIGSEAVTAGKIGSGAVTEAKIGAGAVTVDKIGANAVTGAKLNSDTAGDGLEYASSALNVRSVIIEGTNANAGTLAAGTLVYISANGSFDEADASAIGTAEAIGFLMASTDTGNTGKIMVQGIYDFGSSQSFTAGTIMFLSTTAGELTATAPSSAGEAIKQVGIAWNDQSILLEKMPAVEIV